MSLKQFTLFDLDNDGYLNYHELKVALRALGFDYSKKEVLAIIEEFDSDNRRQISYDDFYRFVANKLVERDRLCSFLLCSLFFLLFRTLSLSLT